MKGQKNIELSVSENEGLKEERILTENTVLS